MLVQLLERSRRGDKGKGKRSFTSGDGGGFLALFYFYAYRCPLRLLFLRSLGFRPWRPKMMRRKKIPAIFFILLRQLKCVLKMRSKNAF